MTHPNATVVNQAYEAFGKGDLDTLKGLVSPDVKWHEAGNPETFQGREAVLQRFGMGAAIEADVDIHALLADDDHVVSLIRARMRKPNGDEVSYPAVEIVHVEGGMITERWAFMDAVPADVAAFFSDVG